MDRVVDHPRLAEPLHFHRVRPLFGFLRSASSWGSKGRSADVGLILELRLVYANVEDFR